MSKHPALQQNIRGPVGILGGGQLARMLALKAHAIGIEVRVLSENEDDPAAQVVRSWTKWRRTSPKAELSDLRDFLKSCAVATFESEFLDADVLGELAKQTGTPIFPEPKHMAIIQDRLNQKELLIQSGLPTAPYLAVKTFAEAAQALKHLGGKAVFKKRRFGYDGYGTFIVRSAAALKKFRTHLESESHGFIAEQLVDFRRELAVMVVRGQDGVQRELPFVETHQENSRCLWVKGPIRERAALSSLSRGLHAMLENLGYVGIMGVELFELSSKVILINELAPRVHNSGHYSMNALTADQFELHLQAVTGQSLAPIQAVAPAFAMYNLLGSTRVAPNWEIGAGPDNASSNFHWYGKIDNRPGRKMGHINSIGQKPELALRSACRVRSQFKL